MSTFTLPSKYKGMAGTDYIYPGVGEVHLKAHFVMWLITSIVLLSLFVFYIV